MALAAIGGVPSLGPWLDICLNYHILGRHRALVMFSLLFSNDDSNNKPLDNDCNDLLALKLLLMLVVVDAEYCCCCLFTVNKRHLLLLLLLLFVDVGA